MHPGMLKTLRLIATIWLFILGGVYAQANASLAFRYDARPTSTTAYDGASNPSLEYDGASGLPRNNTQDYSVPPCKLFGQFAQFLAAEGEGTVQIFRAVGQSETSSILDAGTYGSAPSMGGKYFALTQQGAQDFANASFNAGRQMSVTSTTIPQSVFNHGFLFNDVGGAGASIHFQQDFLPTLYNSMTPIQFH